MYKHMISVLGFVAVWASLGLSTVGFYPSSAAAVTVNYTLEDDYRGWLRPVDGSGDSYRMHYNYTDLQGSLDHSNGNFSLSGAINGSITNEVTGISEASTMVVDLVYYGLYVGVDPNTGTPFDAIGRPGSAVGSAQGTFSVTSTSTNFSLDIVSKGASITTDSTERKQSIYREVVGSGFFDIILGQLSHYGGEEVLKSWIRGSNHITLNDEDYHLYGDFHSTVAGKEAVPEPSTLALLALGLIGAGVSRGRFRKN